MTSGIMRGVRDAVTLVPETEIAIVVAFEGWRMPPRIKVNLSVQVSKIRRDSDGGSVSGQPQRQLGTKQRFGGYMYQRVFLRVHPLHFLWVQ